MSGLLGTDSGSPAEGTVPETPTPLDPTAAAIAAEAARSNPELAENASAYFVKQRRLVEIQTEHLHEQRAATCSCSNSSALTKGYEWRCACF